MSFTMPDVVATRAQMLTAYRDGLRDIIEESTYKVSELREGADEATAMSIEAGEPIDTAIENIDNVRVVLRTDIDVALNAIFGQPVPLPDATAAEVHTPAAVYVSAICPRCGLAQKILATISSELLVSDDGSELRIKAKAKGVSHICGQLPLPVSDDAIGQQELPLDDDVETDEPRLLASGETEDEEEPELVGAEA